MSVWDDGEVVATASTGQSCPISPRLTAMPSAEKWPCPALFSWRSGGYVEMIQFLGTDPQMLPASLGKLLTATQQYSEHGN